MHRIERIYRKGTAHSRSATVFSRLFSLRLLAAPCFAQSGYMSFSVYNVTSVSDDITTLYNGTTMQDNSYGCTHTDYETYAELEDATGDESLGSAAGMIANTSIAIGADGNYYAGGAITYYCSCIMNVAGTGGGSYVPLSNIQAYYYYTGSYNNGQGVYKRCNPIGTVCDVCSVTIGLPAWNYGLFGGVEIHVLSSAICVMGSLEQTSMCYSPDPVPGNSSGTFARKENPAKIVAHAASVHAGKQSQQTMVMRH